MGTKKPLRGSSFAILGDSYSTYEGWITPESEFYYPRPQSVDDVLAVEHTWWHQLMTRQDMRLLLNDAYSGSTVCTDVREHHPESASFVRRADKYFSSLRDAKEQPDYLFVFGGTNDSWLDREPGKLQFADWTSENLHQVLPAFCFVLDHITRQNPESTVVLVVNTKLKPEISEGILAAGQHYGAISVTLTDIDKQHGHPSRLGMEQIARQVEAVLE